MLQFLKFFHPQEISQGVSVIVGTQMQKKKIDKRVTGPLVH